jgi:hypothetical protein
MFNLGTALSVEGEVVALGEDGNRIHFTSVADTAGGSPMAGGWAGVSLQENSRATLYFCDLRYAASAVYSYKSLSELYDCAIENFSAFGFYVDGYTANPPVTAVIEGCVVRQTDAGLLGTGIGIEAYRSADVTVSGSKVRNCLNGMYFLGQGTLAPHFEISGCDIRGHAARGICALAGG